MTEPKPFSTGLVSALLGFAGIAVSPERAEELAAESDALFAEADRVSAFMAPRRDVGMAVQFSRRIVPEDY